MTYTMSNLVKTQGIMCLNEISSTEHAWNLVLITNSVIDLWA